MLSLKTKHANKAKHAKFSEKRTSLTPDMHTYVSENFACFAFLLPQRIWTTEVNNINNNFFLTSRTNCKGQQSCLLVMECNRQGSPWITTSGQTFRCFTPQPLFPQFLEGMWRESMVWDHFERDSMVWMIFQREGFFSMLGLGNLVFVAEFFSFF